MSSVRCPPMSLWGPCEDVPPFLSLVCSEVLRPGFPIRILICQCLVQMVLICSHKCIRLLPFTISTMCVSSVLQLVLFTSKTGCRFSSEFVIKVK